MQVLDFNEFAQDITKAFNMALRDEVIINDKGGNTYKLLQVKKDTELDKSPFDTIPRVKLNVTTQEIVEILRECRAGT